MKNENQMSSNFRRRIGKTLDMLVWLEVRCRRAGKEVAETTAKLARELE
jgi:hypothetical protein